MHILAYVRASLEFFVLVESLEYVAPLPQVLYFSKNQMCIRALTFDKKGTKVAYLQDNTN